MKKVLYCVLLFVATSIVCLIVGYGITRYSVRQEQAVPNTVIETETVNDMDDKAAMNQEQIKPILESPSPPFYVKLSDSYNKNKDDFPELPRIRMVWKSIAAQLSKENRKFIYGRLKEGAHAKDFSGSYFCNNRRSVIL